MLTESALICIYVFVAMIILTLAGIPISVTLFSSSFVGFLIVGGWKITLAQLSGGLMSLSASYAFAVVPFFVALGALAGDTGIAGDAFSCMKIWLSRRKGGLLYAVTLANGIFGACSGVSSAASMVFAKIAYPELKADKYDTGVALSCVSTAGVLSSLIPPSVGILLFCLLTDLSIGKALLCGFSSGLLVIVVMFIAIAIIARVDKNSCPPVSSEKISWKARLKTLKLLVPIGLLFALIVCGPYLGWFPSTVGGAVGMVAILAYALIRRLSLKKIWTGLCEGTHTFASVFMMIVGGQFFGRFVSYTGLARELANMIVEMNASRITMILIFMVFFLALGCFMNVMPIMTISVPILFPVMASVGMDGYALMIVALLLAEVGALTPPVGMAVFTVSQTTGVNPTIIFKRIWPFFITLLFVALLIALVPQTVLWLPDLLG